ncbi:uncharacterized protein LOC127831088 [Dreissena polymorpha]|uniref:uncharacterized protein LOC127831088 n=1 Tax=Dreissena polymorpha TaxID=45954 RepID=UPI002264621B|nr:uncharacterized protein LOC127831088 [Dreissena polymorpha]
MLSGPDLTNKLIGVLMRFKREVLAVVADIEQMFYCFSVAKEHRNVLRFFWYEGNDLSKPLVEYRMCKHVFGNSPSPAVATYGLRKSVRQKFKSLYEGTSMSMMALPLGVVLLKLLTCYGWDYSLPAELEAKWVKWRADLQNLSVVQIPRSYFGRSPQIRCIRVCNSSCRIPGWGSSLWQNCWARGPHVQRTETSVSFLGVLSYGRELCLRLPKFQSEFYADEISVLRLEQSVQKCSPIVSLNPFLDQGDLLRVGKRLSRSSLSQSEKHPLILPGKHHVAKLLVQHYHCRVQHQGLHYTEGAVRAAGFWIASGKRMISSVLHHCVKCKKLRGQFACQRMLDLPLAKVEEVAPFTYTGVDVFGLWHITSRRTRGGLTSSKRGAVFFSCQTVRAVHIEVLGDISSSRFINALRMFVAVRGKVRQFRSDRRTNFIGATDNIQVEDVPTRPTSGRQSQFGCLILLIVRILVVHGNA